MSLLGLSYRPGATLTHAAIWCSRGVCRAGSGASLCCKRRIHERDSNPAPLSFRDSALPIRLPGITHTHGSFLLHCSPAPTGCVLTPYLARGGYDGSWIRAIARRQCCKRRIHERDSNPAPLSFRDSALPIRLPGITHTHGSFLLHCSPAPTGCGCVARRTHECV